MHECSDAHMILKLNGEGAFKVKGEGQRLLYGHQFTGVTAQRILPYGATFEYQHYLLKSIQALLIQCLKYLETFVLPFPFCTFYLSCTLLISLFVISWSVRLCVCVLSRIQSRSLIRTLIQTPISSRPPLLDPGPPRWTGPRTPALPSPRTNPLLPRLLPSLSGR